MMSKAPKSHVAFHAHLDACRQCRDRPWELCSTGDALLRATAKDDQIDPKGKVYGVSPLPGTPEGPR